MPKIDLTTLEWRELVFLGKNKNYGAYVLRSQSSKRHNIAVIIVMILAFVGFSIPKMLELFEEKEQVTEVDVKVLSTLDKTDTKKEEVKKIINLEPPPALKSSIKFVAPVIKKDEEVRDEDEMKSQEDLTKTDVTISIADVKGTDDENAKLIEDIKENVTQVVVEEKVFDFAEQQPSFPGGTQELQKYLSANLKYPAIAQEMGIEGRVVVQFVVSKTGEITNVQVVKSLDDACDKEAIRVVSSLPRWLPGKNNGEPVTCKFTLPVVFRLQ